MVTCTAAGNISAEATAPAGNILGEATRQLGRFWDSAVVTLRDIK